MKFLSPVADLPVSQNDGKKQTDTIHGLRKRISSTFSLNIQPYSTASSAWVIRKSKSMPSFGEIGIGPIRRWWDWIIGRFVMRSNHMSLPL